MQLQLLTAIVKLFLKKPTDTQELVQQVLTLATQVQCLYVWYDELVQVMLVNAVCHNLFSLLLCLHEAIL